MRHYYLTYDSIGIMFSDIIENKGEKTIRVYANDEQDPNSNLEFSLPDYEIIRKQGFSDDLVKDIIFKVRTCEDVLWHLAKKEDELFS